MRHSIPFGLVTSAAQAGSIDLNESGAAPVWHGRNWPLGATWSPISTNFAVYAPNATAVILCLFDEAGIEHQYELTDRSLGVWCGAIPHVSIGTRYSYRVDGPWEPTAGLRFNRQKLLVDPYARAISGTIAPEPALYAHEIADPSAISTLDSAGCTPRGVVVHDDFDWEGDVPMYRRWRDTVIYELHVRGFTQLNPRIPEQLRGTYAGLGHPETITYLTDLGVTAIELLPVHQFFSEPALLERGLENYWGYNSLGYFAPHHAYSAGGDRGQQVTEFKQMVKDLHAAGIEVILDVVFNHTAEGGPLGPILSFRGFDDLGSYRRVQPDHDADPTAEDTYWDVTGCGNTVDSTHPQMMRLILDSLRYWVTDMHVDGFRFDLMSALTRTGYAIDMRGALLTTISQDPVLRHAKLIAEPWDASADGYRLGQYPPPWVEWNDQYRDTIRDFWRGRSAGVRTVATRIAGSADLYADDGRSPYASVNFVTAHDGFTLRDLVSYNTKHNEANGEDNRDGTDNNRSHNWGTEGETDDPEIIATRHRIAANLLATLCLSNGVPMLAAGDERGRTQGGNNNAFCHDDPVSWLDWSDETWLDLHELTRTALRIRREHPALRQRHWFEGRPTVRGGPKDLAWLHPEGREMAAEDWHDDGLRVIGLFLSGSPLRDRGPHGEVLHDDSFLLWLNGSGEPCTCLLADNPWIPSGVVVLSTDDALPVGTAVRAGQTMPLSPHSLVLLQTRTDAHDDQ